MSPTPTNIAYGSDNPAAPAIPADSVRADSIPAEPTPPEANRRKRGEELEQAIRTACVAELAACGYGELSIESVASRAQTGKASIYRRWPTKQDLVMDTLTGVCSGPLAFATDAINDEEGTTRDALFQVMVRIVGLMTGPAAPAMRAVWSEAMRDSGFGETIQQQFFEPRRAALTHLLERGIQRGEVRPDVRPEFVHDTIGGVLSTRILLRGDIPSDQDLAAFLDEFVMPAIEVRE